MWQAIKHRDFRSVIAALQIEEERKEIPKIIIGAIANENISLLRVLRECRVDFNSSTMVGIPIIYAARQGSSMCVTFLLNEADVDPDKRSDKDKKTALSHAVSRVNHKMVQELLDAGADVNLCDSNWRSPLMISIEKNNAKMAKILIKAGADVNQRDTVDYYTPLFVAAVNGYHDCLDVLIAAKADVIVTVKDAVGNSMLHLASKDNDHITVKKLAEAGFMLDTGNWLQQTALDVAVCGAHLETIEVLLRAGVSANSRDLCQTPFISRAAEDRHPQVVRLFLRHGADPNALDKNGLSVLTRACLAHCEQSVQILLEHGADVNILSPETPSLFFCMFSKSSRFEEETSNAVSIVRHLLCAGCDLTQRDEDGNDACEKALSKGWMNMALTLYHAQSNINEYNVIQTEHSFDDMADGLLEKLVRQRREGGTSLYTLVCNQIRKSLKPPFTYTKLESLKLPALVTTSLSYSHLKNIKFKTVPHQDKKQ